MRHLTLFLFLAACSGGPTPDEGAPETSSAAAPSETEPAAAEATGEAEDHDASAAHDKAAVDAHEESHQLAAYDGTYADDPALTAVQVATWSPEELSRKRNEIYARYGRAFKSPDLKKHFQAQSWYQVREDFTTEWLTANDKANAALITSFEGKTPDYTDIGARGALGFFDASSAIILDRPEMGLYMASGQSRRYAARGETRVITWTGADAFDPTDPAVKDAELWTWDGDSWTREPLPKPQG